MTVKLKSALAAGESGDIVESNVRLIDTDHCPVCQKRMMQVKIPTTKGTLAINACLPHRVALPKSDQ